jgi:hypothetical protein
MADDFEDGAEAAGFHLSVILGLQVANPEINRLRQVAACMVAAEEGIRNIARWVRHQKLDAEGGGNQQE